MNLSEWAAASYEEQKDWVVKCMGSYDEMWEYQDMTAEAARLLRTELSSITEVETVVVGGTDELLKGKLIPVHPMPCLVICTLLPESHTLEGIPSRFLGFPVEQKNIGDWRTAYLGAWKRFFKELKGWDEERTMVWAGERAEWLKHPDSPYYSKQPIFSAIDGLISLDAKSVTGDRRNSLHSEIRKVFEDARKGEAPIGQLANYSVDNCDWDSVRPRVRELLESYVKSAT